jgi:hypothetical protein
VQLTIKVEPSVDNLATAVAEALSDEHRTVTSDEVDVTIKKDASSSTLKLERSVADD